jgi:hypothetical protein
VLTVWEISTDPLPQLVLPPSWSSAVPSAFTSLQGYCIRIACIVDHSPGLFVPRATETS